MNKLHICPKCGGTKFTTTAHVMQEWVVDETGNFQEEADSCIQIDAGPDDDNDWICTNCGETAVIVTPEEAKKSKRNLTVKKQERLLSMASKLSAKIMTVTEIRAVLHPKYSYPRIGMPPSKKQRSVFRQFSQLTRNSRSSKTMSLLTMKKNTNDMHRSWVMKAITSQKQMPCSLMATTMGRHITRSFSSAKGNVKPAINKQFRFAAIWRQADTKQGGTTYAYVFNHRI